MENKIVSVERARLAPFVERVNGGELRESFRDAFERAAGRYMLGRIEAREFRGITGELIRDAAGTAAQQDRDTGTVKVWGKTPAPVKRARWAVWPTDGSGRPTLAERIVFALVAVASVLVIGWVVLLFAEHGSDTTTAPAPGAAVSVGESIPDSWPGGKFGTPRITLDMDTLPSSDCWYEVTMTDADGEPGGLKIANVEPLCP